MADTTTDKILNRTNLIIGIIFAALAMGGTILGTLTSHIALRLKMEDYVVSQGEWRGRADARAKEQAAKDAYFDRDITRLEQCARDHGWQLGKD